MKIGIITFHCVQNYGAILQAYALQNYLTSIGHNVYMIDYQPDILLRQYTLNPFGRGLAFKKRLSLFIARKERYLKKYRFDEFINRSIIKTENKYYLPIDFERYPLNYDSFICGSDQIWNTSLLPNDTIFPYFLGWQFKGSAKRIAYAASFGIDTINQNVLEKIRYYIKQFDYLSVRELNAATLLNKNFGIIPMQVVDPVFLLNKDTWSIQCQTKMPKENYILTYMLTDEERILSAKLAQKMNLNIYSLDRLWGKYKPPQPYIAPGPKEFIELFHNAACVITGSFHGTAFSIIFKKPFVSFIRGNRKGRIQNLLESFNLTSQLIEHKNSLDIMENKIKNEWYKSQNTHDLIDHKISQSKFFIDEALS